ncbi:MAG: ribosomal RNA small subunit methyltransferase A [Candidatus Kapabacteria bacterium]|nr:ribosomal RNA small subunit methyltransferase A [Candidatus Kapabacteria bacterium]
MSTNKGFAPQRRFSQNFLTDVSTARAIVTALGLRSGDAVVEIGPGKGALTTHLAESSAQRIIGVELDERAEQYLLQQPWVKSGRVQVIRADALTLRVRDIIPDIEREHRCVIGNIPYSITSPLLFWLFDQRSDVSRAVIMMQREVARRCVAGVGSKDYGILSVATWLNGGARSQFHVKPGSFFPRPDVTSTVLRFDLSERPAADLPVEQFMSFVRAAFSQRRKVMTNALASWAGQQGIDIRNLSSVCGVELARTRAEECTPELLGAIFRQLSDHIGTNPGRESKG